MPGLHAHVRDLGDRTVRIWTLFLRERQRGQRAERDSREQLCCFHWKLPHGHTEIGGSANVFSITERGKG
jgi:hypothetical protein